MSDENLDKLLHTDPLVEAEKYTGKSYKTDPETQGLGMLGLIVHGERKRNALTAARDTHYSLPFAELVGIAGELGFVQVFSQPFAGRAGQEEFMLFWRHDGVLLRAESYTWERGDTVKMNTADIYYNYRISPEYKGWHPGGSSGWTKENGRDVLIGHMDVREGLRHHLADLEKHGEFLNPWVKRPFLWLVNYVQDDVPGYDYKAIAEAVIAQLPEHVRAAVTP